MKRNLWTNFEDMILALTVMNLTREGYTYKASFEIASSNLNRTASACSGRWYRKVKTITNDILSTNAKTSKVVAISSKKKEVVAAS